MSKDKHHPDDLFQRQRRLRAGLPEQPRSLRSQADRATAEDLLQALVASVAVIAHADGRLDMAERRKLVETFLGSPALDGFSVSELGEELADHMRAYGYDAKAAEQRALSCISALTLTNSERRTVRDACHKVIVADGLVHPVELGALHRIEQALGLAEAGR